jgi:hypothetical protein
VLRVLQVLRVIEVRKESLVEILVHRVLQVLRVTRAIEVRKASLVEILEHRVQQALRAIQAVKALRATQAVRVEQVEMVLGLFDCYSIQKLMDQVLLHHYLMGLH